MNDMAYVLQAWLPLLVWQQVDAPQYRKGFITITCLSAALIGTGFITKVLHRAQIRRLAHIPEVNGLNAKGAIISRLHHHSLSQERGSRDETIGSSDEDVGSEQVQVVLKS